MAVLAHRLTGPQRRDVAGWVAWLCPTCRPLFLGGRLPVPAEAWCHHDASALVASRPPGAWKAYAVRHESLASRCPGRRRAVWRACRSVVSPSFGLARPVRPRFGMS